MSSTYKLRLTTVQKAIFFAGTVAMITFLFLVLTAGTPQPELDEATLTQRALEVAKVEGLQGKAVAQRGLRMTYSDWLPFVDANLGTDAAQVGSTPEMPVFIFALRGEIQNLGPGQRPIGDDGGPEHFTSMVIILDARTGELLELHLYPPGTKLPIPVP
jgi:hypothetical protein